MKQPTSKGYIPVQGRVYPECRGAREEYNLVQGQSITNLLCLQESAGEAGARAVQCRGEGYNPAVQGQSIIQCKV